MDLKKSSWFVLLSYLILFALACEKEEDIIPINKETEHFILITNSQLSSNHEIDEVLERAEVLYTKILQELGESHRPQNKITIRLEGIFEEESPYFDNLGIHLFRYSRSEGGYLSALAHEMVHAFHEGYYIQYDPYSWENYPYLDEGFAEYVAQLVDGSKTGFPWYGYNEFAIVGNLVLSENWIPHHILREQHFEINDPCNIQAYTQRSSWMRYIDETYGRDTLLILNYPEAAPTDDFFINTLGVNLPTVDSSWESWVIEKYNSTPLASEIAEAFHERTSWYSHCEF